MANHGEREDMMDLVREVVAWIEGTIENVVRGARIPLADAEGLGEVFGSHLEDWVAHRRQESYGVWRLTLYPPGKRDPIEYQYDEKPRGLRDPESRMEAAGMVVSHIFMRPASGGAIGYEVKLENPDTHYSTYWYGTWNGPYHAMLMADEQED